jgi:GT2 family glycosyltransferase
VGGLDEDMFQVNFNDVDYCLKLRDRGLKVVWTPHATLRHEESVSQAAPDVERLDAEEKYKRKYRGSRGGGREMAALVRGGSRL